ncbi:MAG: BatD family protein [Akkermansiaceae bacterium]|nr:BatD family protein [Akkermansiaceae bacterium]
MNIDKLLTAIAAFMMSAVIGLTAPEAQMHVSMSAKSFYVGEEFLYEILISPADKVTADEAEGDDELAIQFLKQEVIKRDDISTVVLRYRMMPLSPGAVMLPSISVEVGDQVLTTDEEAFIDVKQAESYPGMEVIRAIPERDFYLGEPFMVDYTWKSPLELNGFRAVKFNLPLFYDPAFKIRSPHHWIEGDDKEAIGFPVANTRVIGRYGSLTEEGKRFHTVSFSKIVTPVKTGEFAMRPSTLLTSYVAPPGGRNKGGGWKTNYPSYFNNNFFAETEGETFKKYYATSKSRTIRVLPLPDAGRPHDFQGLVGACKVSVTATPTVLNAGDPITLTIVVDGYAFPEVFELPDLSAQAAFTRQFAMPPRQSSGRIEGKKKTYIRTLRPLAQDATTIPAVRIPYFDPRTKSYGVAESAPIPITVKAAEMVTAFDATMSGTGPLKNLVEKNPEGIRANVASLDAIHQSGLSELQCLLLLLVVPPAGFLVFYVASAQHRLMRKDPVRARAMGAMKRFNKSMRRFSGPDEGINMLDEIVRSYFADKLNLARHAHTFEELEDIIGDRVDIEPLREIYASSAYLTYREKDVKADLVSLAENARKCIQTINRSNKI